MHWDLALEYDTNHGPRKSKVLSITLNGYRFNFEIRNNPLISKLEITKRKSQGTI